MKRLSWSFLIVCLITGCTVGPDYQRPVVAVPTQFKEVPKGWKLATPIDDCERGKWWEVFQDPILNALEERLNVSNQNIAIAAAQYQQARALLIQARAAYFPTIATTNTATRQKTPSDTADAVVSSSGSLPSTSVHHPFNTFNLSLDATWEPDIWGGVRRSVEASHAGVKASKAQLASVRLLAQASLAQFYFQVRGLDGNQRVLDKTVNNYKKLMKITQNQYNAGTVSRSNILQVQSQLELAQVLALDNGILRAQYEHAIAVLLGSAPANLKISPNDSTLNLPETPVSLPSVLLERRPDIAQAERLVAQANANIGVAIAAYFPVISLSESGGYNSSHLETLFSKPAQFWSLGIAIAQTLFDGGIRGGMIDQACAILKQNVAQYRQTVLIAFQEVEDNLVAIRILNEEFKRQKQAVKTSQRSLDLVLNAYKSGTQSLAEVLIAENTLFENEKAANDIEYRRMVASVGLIKALGGGWNERLL